MHRDRTILAGDIGGTKTNIAVVSLTAGRMVVRNTTSYPSSAHSSILKLIAAFTAAHPVTVDAAAFGIAGPVIGGRCEATNLPWIVDAAEIGAALGGVPSVLLNDLEATSYGILHLAPEDRLVLNEGRPDPAGAIAVIAAGTGLGEGGLIWNGSEYIALPSEGGHTDFAPRNELEIDLLRFLLRRHERVSYERIVSGPGLYTLYEFMRERLARPEPAWLTQALNAGDPSVAVSTAGLEAKDEACRQAVDLFISLYGAEAGNLALKLLARGGIYVAGGIAPKMISRIKDGPFLPSLFHKGRFSPLLRTMPVTVVLNDRIALLGAAHAVLSSTAANPFPVS
jgi:glucokinase